MAQEKLIIDFWDVGQGDGTVIRLPNNEIIIIDVGPRSSPIIDWLDKFPNIHAVVLTHNDEDHAGSLPSLVRIPGISIRTVYMLLDRPKSCTQFKQIWRPVREEEKKGRLSVVGLATDTIIWQGMEMSLQVIYPTFSENIEAEKPNESSAIVCLYYKTHVKIIWPGDAPMEIINKKCANTLPHLLQGPHHGGPVDKKKPDFTNWINSFTPERVFISVGTNNRYDLPSQDYIQLQANRGVHVTCTQLTKLCDAKQINSKRPIIQTAALLGLRSPRSGVSCRGCLRLTIENGLIMADPWDSEHSLRIKKLTRPKCIFSGK